MMQQGRQLGLVTERSNQIFLFGEIRQDFFDGNRFFKPLNTGLFDTKQLSHTARADFIQKLIFTKLNGFKYCHKNKTDLQPAGKTPAPQRLVFAGNTI